MWCFLPWAGELRGVCFAVRACSRAWGYRGGCAALSSLVCCFLVSSHPAELLASPGKSVSKFSACSSFFLPFISRPRTHSHPIMRSTSQTSHTKHAHASRRARPVALSASMVRGSWRQRLELRRRGSRMGRRSCRKVSGGGQLPNVGGSLAVVSDHFRCRVVQGGAGAAHLTAAHCVLQPHTPVLADRSYITQ